MNIDVYKKRFYNLMESTMGNVKPLISEEECVKLDPPSLFIDIKNKLKPLGYNEVEGAVSCSKTDGEFRLEKDDLYLNLNTYQDGDKRMCNIYQNICGKTQKSDEIPYARMDSDLKNYYNKSIGECLPNSKI